MARTSRVRTSAISAADAGSVAEWSPMRSCSPAAGPPWYSRRASSDLTCALAYWSRNARCSVTLIPRRPTNSDSVGAAQLLHEFILGTLDLVHPHASPARQWIHLPQLIEYG